MKKEDKELLLKDICSRLPYGVKCDIGDNKPYTLSSISDDYDGILIRFKEQKNSFNVEIYLSECKPYLFPLSILTENQRSEISKLLIDTENTYPPYGEINTKGCDNLFICSAKQSIVFMDYCFMHHLDVNGLIEKGLAIDATNLGIYK